MSSQETGLEIAVVGVACRFPGAESADAFWKNLREGVESIKPFTEEELLAAGVTPAELANPNYVKAGSTLEAVETFDAAFFGIGPSEASVMDPQHRLFLECVHQALEVAGYSNATDRMMMALFGGVSASDYVFQNISKNPRMLESMRLQVLFSNDKDYVTSRTAYKLNLRGPAITIQTACSSALVATHLACQSLLSGEVDLALAGGVTVKAQQKRGYVYHPQGGLFSPDGHCRPFDVRADGAVFGNGLGVVALRRLSDALADGDVIHAVIKGSAVANDGSTRVGFTAPGIDGQTRVIQAALRMAEVDPSTVSYVEAHGSGTSLGDPIEVRALQQAFGRAGEGTCAIGSVKGNVGHLDSAAGAAGLIKTILSLKNRELAPTLHYTAPNAKIQLEGSPFYVSAKLKPWTTANGPRRAGVSSFGVGGTNAHVVLEEAPERGPAAPSRAQQLLLLSARTQTALETATDALARHLEEHPEESLADVAFTLATTRKRFPFRRALSCRTTQDAARALAKRDGASLLQGQAPEEPRPVAFVFSGLGDQYVNMGLGLYQSEPVFRAALQECAQALAALGVDLLPLLYPNGTDAQEATGGLDLRRMLGREAPADDAATVRLGRTTAAHPALFSVGYALAQQWMAWGIRPSAVAGYSLGEYLAACLAGVFSLEDALKLVVARARLMEALPQSAMLGVSLPAAQLRRELEGSLWIAAVNGPSASVVAGEEQAVAALEQQLTARGVVARRVPALQAFHTPLMRPAMDGLRDVLAQVALRPPELPLASNVSGTWATDEVTDPEYWVRHSCEPVRFSDVLSTLWEDPQRILVEVGPGQTLCGFALQHPVAKENPRALVLPSMHNRFDRQPDLAFLHASAAKLWLAGLEPTFSALHEGEQRRKVALPTHPYERQRYWIDPVTGPGEAAAGKEQRASPDDWFYEPQWKRVPLEPAAQLPEAAPWVVLTPATGVGQRLVERLRARGERVLAVRPAEGFAQLGEDEYAVRPSSQEDCAALFKALRGLPTLPARVVHLFALDAQGAAQTREHGFFSAIAVGQALGRSGWHEPLELCVATRGAYDVTGEEPLCADQALALGPCKVLGQEQPFIRCRNVDLAWPDGAGAAHEEALAKALAEELSTDGPERTVALRGGARWVQRFEPVKLAPRPAALTRGGSYLVTGGLGRISLIAAGVLAEAGATTLVLTTRGSFPERAAWDAHLARSPGDAVSARIQKVRALEALGAKVEIVTADAADAARMAQVVEQAGTLRGVVHAAGVVARDAFRTVQEMGRADCERHLHPKADGLNALAAAIEGQPLELCLLVSSVSSMLGGLGYAAYAGANAYLDTFARERARRSALGDGPRWLSLDLDGGGFSDEELAEVFRRALAHPARVQLANSATSLQARVEQWTDPGRAASSAPTASSRRPRPELRNPFTAPAPGTEQKVAELWQEFLFVDRVGSHDNFFELGGSSFLGLQLLARMISEFKVPISIATLFAAPTVSTLARVLEQGEGSEAVDEGADRGAERRSSRRGSRGGDPRTGAEE